MSTRNPRSSSSVEEGSPPPSQAARPPRRFRRWGLGLLVLLYVISPFDLVPEALLPVLGWLDDAGVIAAAVTWWIRSRRRVEVPAAEELAPTASSPADTT